MRTPVGNILLTIINHYLYPIGFSEMLLSIWLMFLSSKALWFFNWSMVLLANSHCPRCKLLQKEVKSWNVDTSYSLPNGYSINWPSMLESFSFLFFLWLAFIFVILFCSYFHNFTAHNQILPKIKMSAILNRHVI